jgi:ribosome-associated translation inhibitor RaiA
MQIQINTDRNIKGHESFTSDISRTVETEFIRFSDQITRVELHLSDNNGYKNGEDDKECLVEVRLSGKQPIVVTEYADTLDGAIKGAVGKMVRSIEKSLSKVEDRARFRVGSRQHYKKISGE